MRAHGGLGKADVILPGMRSLASTIGRLAVLALVVAACSSGGSPGQSATPADDAWRTASLRDVVSGEQFRIGDLKGNVVAIEAMAIWCGNCRVQQGEAQAALKGLASSDVVYISLDVDPNERDQDLAAYARREGFTWRFAVASPEMSRSLAATFGNQILSPPSTPLVVLGRDGALVEKHLGIKSAADIEALIEEHLQ